MVISRRKKRLLKGVIILFLMILFVFIFRVNLLRGIGNALIYSNPPEPCDALFVLGGAPNERAKHAANLYQKGFAHKIICTGAITPENIDVVGLNHTEAEITQFALTKRYHVPDSITECLLEGTSTKEEADAILQYALKHKLTKIMIVSTAFHTGRVKYIFRKKFKSYKHIKIYIQPAPALDYNEKYWWKDEEGLLTVYTEYAKKMYYFFKY